MKDTWFVCVSEERLFFIDWGYFVPDLKSRDATSCTEGDKGKDVLFLFSMEEVEAYLRSRG